jgi:hypothetical protein
LNLEFALPIERQFSIVYKQVKTDTKRPYVCRLRAVPFWCNDVALWCGKTRCPFTVKKPGPI